jgi:hypothetical protein
MSPKSPQPRGSLSPLDAILDTPNLNIGRTYYANILNQTVTET